MDIIELILDEESEGLIGIEAVSIVEAPAIESNFLTLSEQEIKLAKVDDEKRILMGAALIPNKPIFRRNDTTDFYVYFSEKTVRRASELFFMNSMQNNATLEHEMEINGLTVVESWIVEDTEMDKSKKYGLEVPKGTWMISMKVQNDDVWNNYVKEGKVKGFSIEGYFADSATVKNPELTSEWDMKEQESQNKINKIVGLLQDDKTKLYSQIVNKDLAIIDDRLAYSTKEKAEQMAKNIGCEGSHMHEFEDQEWFMPCEKHEMKKPCYAGYEMIGFKIKNGKKVPNCVPIK